MQFKIFPDGWKDLCGFNLFLFPEIFRRKEGEFSHAVEFVASSKAKRFFAFYRQGAQLIFSSAL